MMATKMSTKCTRGKFAHRGARARVVRYPIGISGKQTARLFPEPKWEKNALFITDSNGRDLVLPCVVRPSIGFPFNLSVISVPGGCIMHGDIELRCPASIMKNVNAVIIGLGTNDVLGFSRWEVNERPQYVVDSILRRAKCIIGAAQELYPHATVYFNSILPQSSPSGRIVPMLNVALKCRTWLTDVHIDSAMHLLSEEFPNMDGLQSCLAYSKNRNIPIYTPKSDFVQILLVHDDHWVTVTNKFTKSKNSLNIYDSSKCDYTDSDKLTLSKLLNVPATCIKCHFPQVPQQKIGSGNCGLYAIAFAKAVCQGFKPETLNYPEYQLRSLIHGMLKQETIDPLYTENNTRNVKPPKLEFSINIFCNCRLAADDNEYIQCSKCKTWLHFDCVAEEIPSEAKSIGVKWFCINCSD
uniref:uncharacterized protein LOC108950180 n=1 Tax=Ciona intestinalis TaxID=7719 RepID=UPI000EF4BD92|nr:uncharacterized protein LOC108950180 [Ciona intestinalis]|eukprot:XP_026693744.1 uncharacterized protein LOC108950180 [Ciona intestinalis]